MTIAHSVKSPRLADDLLLEHIRIGVIINRLDEHGRGWTTSANNNAILYKMSACGPDIVFDRPDRWSAMLVTFSVAKRTLYHIASYSVF